MEALHCELPLGEHLWDPPSGTTVGPQLGDIPGAKFWKTSLGVPTRGHTWVTQLMTLLG